MQEQPLLDNLSKAYAVLSDDDPLKAAIFQAAQEIQKDLPENLIKARLSRYLTLYFIKHTTDAKPEIVQLHKEVTPAATKYKGTALQTILFGSLFKP